MRFMRTTQTGPIRLSSHPHERIAAIKAARKDVSLPQDGIAPIEDVAQIATRHIRASVSTLKRCIAHEMTAQQRDELKIAHPRRSIARFA